MNDLATIEEQNENKKEMEVGTCNKTRSSRLAMTYLPGSKDKKKE